MEKNNTPKPIENNSCRKVIRIFGRWIYISKVPMRNKGVTSRTRNRLHSAAWVTKEHRCDSCGCETRHFWDMCYHSKLDPTHISAERWLPKNTIMLCKKCNAAHQFAKTRSYYRYRDSDIRKAMQALGHPDKDCDRLIETLTALPLPEESQIN